MKLFFSVPVPCFHSKVAMDHGPPGNVPLSFYTAMYEMVEIFCSDDPDKGKSILQTLTLKVLLL